MQRLDEDVDVAFSWCWYANDSIFVVVLSLSLSFFDNNKNNCRGQRASHMGSGIVRRQSECRISQVESCPKRLAIHAAVVVVVVGGADAMVNGVIIYFTMRLFKLYLFDTVGTCPMSQTLGAKRHRQTQSIYFLFVPLVVSPV